MVAKTGRRTQSWASVCMGYRAWVTLSGLLCLNCGAVEQRVVGAGGDGLIAAKPVDDADLVALDFARDDDAEVGGIVVDGEDLVGIGGFVADHGVARHRTVLAPPDRQRTLGEVPPLAPFQSWIVHRGRRLSEPAQAMRGARRPVRYRRQSGLLLCDSAGFHRHLFGGIDGSRLDSSA